MLVLDGFINRFVSGNFELSPITDYAKRDKYLYALILVGGNSSATF